MEGVQDAPRQGSRPWRRHRPVGLQSAPIRPREGLPPGPKTGHVTCPRLERTVQSVGQGQAWGASVGLAAPISLPSASTRRVRASAARLNIGLDTNPHSG